MKYNPNKIEQTWQKYWADNKTFAAHNPSFPFLQGLSDVKPKYYVLDMFPYPSGAGLHVGHPLGYIASDIVARYKRHKGFNVLHPQGYDSFGLPAEQYAIQTGQHPDKTTKENIARYRQQLDKIGFSFDWDREVRTSNADYYKHTQWIFIQLFNSWYNKTSDKAEDVSTLILEFEKSGNSNINAVCDENIKFFSASEWNISSSDEQQKILLQYRLTYLAEAEVNWCPGLGTVLANDEIINGVSERGGHQVIRKKMTQWSMRISAYAERLLQGLDTIDWSESIKETQRNWIGKSVGAMVTFNAETRNKRQEKIDVFTTRPDTIFGVTFMTLAPEHPLVQEITTNECRQSVNDYIEKTAKRSERERMADVKTISGVFTGAYVEHPFTKEPIPVWIGDYVLAGYGTGAVMAVPCGDERDYAFANFFKGQQGMPEIKNIISPLTPKGGTLEILNKEIDEAFTSKEGFVLQNSDFLNELNYKQATKKVIEELEKINQGSGKTNYRLRDAVFSRQRYWGEPFPVYYKNGIPHMIPEDCLPILLPEVENYLPTEDGLPPLGNAKEWYWDAVKRCVTAPPPSEGAGGRLELNTMPGWAGSSWYWLRYMDSKNENEFASQEAIKYWESVDLYIGGSEHATGHLLYSRFWNKFLKDKGYAPTEEPFKKLINQGMILGMSAFVHKIKDVAYYKYDDTIKEELMNERNELFDDLFSNLLGNNIISWDLLDDKKEHVAIAGDLYNLGKVADGIDFDFTDLTTNGFELDKITFTTYSTHSLLDYVNVQDELDFQSFNLWSREDLIKRPITNIKQKIKVSREVEKMSKSKYNVVSPDDICEEYGADTLRLYEMFLGPLEQSKPWNTAGISGVFGFLKKLWRLYFDENGLIITENEPSKESLKSLHKTIKKVTEDIENFSFNTSVSQFMICVNELQGQNCHERSILEPLAILISPYAPHIAEELWFRLKDSKIEKLNNYVGISQQPFPICDEKYLIESEKEYPVSFNGKMRFTINLPLDLTIAQIEEIILKDDRTIKNLEGNVVRKVIIVPGKVINFVM